MVIGGIAVIAHGVQRMTTDIDAVIQGDAVSVTELIARLRAQRIVPRIAAAEAFAAKNLVLLTRHEPTEVDLDLSLGWTAFEREALAARKVIRYGAARVPMARVEDLLVFKAIAGRSRDVDDAITLLNLYPRVDVKRVRLRVIALADLAEAPELVRGLDAILRAGKRGHAASAALGVSRSSKAARRPTKKKALTEAIPTTDRRKQRKRKPN
jgi:hypothetical protein